MLFRHFMEPRVNMGRMSDWMTKSVESLLRWKLKGDTGSTFFTVLSAGERNVTVIKPDRDSLGNIIMRNEQN